MRSQIRGHATTERKLHKLFDRYYNAVDRMNQDYHMHFQLTKHHNPNTWALLSASFYFFMTTHALYEEHVAAHAFEMAHRKKSAAAAHNVTNLPHFIHHVALQLLHRWEDPSFA